MEKIEIKLSEYYYAKKDIVRLMEELNTIKRAAAEAHLDAYGSRSSHDIKIKTNRISNPTYEIVQRIVDDFQDQASAVEEKIKEKRRVMEALEHLILILEPREQEYVKLRYFEQRPLTEVLMKVEREPISESTGERIRQSIIKKLKEDK